MKKGERNWMCERCEKGEWGEKGGDDEKKGGNKREREKRKVGGESGKGVYKIKSVLNVRISRLIVDCKRCMLYFHNNCE